MGELTLLSDYCLDTTVLSNIYIDEYMASNNEAQVKIYLYLLRNLSSGKGVSVCSIADFFNYTVQDVERALLFMQKQGLMKLEMADDRICGIRILPLVKKEVIMFSSKPEVSKDNIKEFMKLPEVKELTFVSEQYIGKPLVQDDIQNIYYINKTLNLPFDVIEYLVEYCVGLKKNSFSYMAKVAKDWADSSINTVEEAKNYTLDCPKEIYSIFKAFGIRGGNRKPQPGEAKFCKRWINEYGFSMDVIEKACERTVEKTHSVSFEYADAILRGWRDRNVNTVSDIEKLDAEFANKNSLMVNKETEKGKKSRKPSAASKFNGFTQREYNFDELEKKLMNN